MEDLNKRQSNLLNYLYHHSDQYISTKQLAEEFSVSARTIASDLSLLHNLLDENKGLQLHSVQGKGSRIIVSDRTQAITNFPYLENEHLEYEDEKTTLAESVILYTLSKNTYVAKSEIINQFYISESSLYSLLKLIKDILKDYHLSLESKSNHGYRITGSEIDKRLFIMRNERIDHLGDVSFSSDQINTIYEILVDAFISFKYPTDERTLQNITRHILVSTQRIRKGFIMNEEPDPLITSDPVYMLSQHILSRVLAAYHLESSQFQSESQYLAYMILGKISFATDTVLQERIALFINKAFQEINAKYSINILPLEDLKISLAMHLAPLYYRARSGSPATNIMSTEIKQSFILANDIASFFAEGFCKEFGVHITRDEISYLSLYFNYALERSHVNQSGKRMLLITSMRKAETMLLQHRIFTWFPTQISEISICSLDSLSSFNADDYDLFFCTEEVKNIQFPTLSIFPDSRDFERISSSLNGYKDIEGVLARFSRECFYYGKAADKNEALSIVCGNAHKVFALPESFYDEVMAHEDIANSYFGNMIAIPHPLAPVSDDTFASVAILEKPIKWDGIHDVQMVILVSIEKNNPSAQQFWYSISGIIKNSNGLNAFFRNVSYDEFVLFLKNSLIMNGN